MLSLPIQHLKRHWDTALLIAAGAVFLWQATGFFLPPEPQRLKLSVMSQSRSLPIVLAFDAVTQNAQELPTAEVETLVAKDLKRAHPHRYPPKKPKTVLKPGSIHLNTVTLAQLDLLPGVGPKLGQRILDYRKVHGPFATVEDLKQVKGIGDKNFEKMKLYLAL